MVHKYKLGGFNIVLDINSGAVHSVDDLSYEVLDYIKTPLTENIDDRILSYFASHGEETVRETYEEIFSLYKNGLLFSEGSEVDIGFYSDSSPVKAMCLHIAHDCNLRCRYCFASTGNFGGGRKLMDVNTGKKAIDFLLENSGKRRNLEVDFFGGEPLMNFETIKVIVEYARSREEEYNKNFRFTVTTNGILLNDGIIDYINKEMSNVVLSLDGRKEINDRMRPIAISSNGRKDMEQGLKNSNNVSSNNGSYDIILDKYKKLVASRGDKDYYIRGTFTKYNLDFTEDVRHINSLGFDQISIEPVVSDENNGYAITGSDLPAVFSEYEKLAEYIISEKENGSGINFFHFMIDLEQGPCVIKRLRGCGCGNEYVAVTPDGDIFPCHQFAGREEWKMGNLSDGILDKKKKEYFSKTTIYDKEECNNCWAKFYCSGGCNANNYIYEGNVKKSHTLSCEMEKKRIECAIMIKCALY